MKKILITLFFLFVFIGKVYPVDLKATWIDNSNNEDGFRLELCSGDCTVNGIWNVMVTTGPNITTLFPVSIIVNTVTSFRIVAFNLVGETFSNIFIARAPNAPTLFSFTTGP